MKLKDGYKKLIGTSYNGDISLILLSNGGNLGYDISSTANTLVLRNANGLIESSLATGTAPLKVASTTLVENLNADLLDGLEGSFYKNRYTYNVAKGKYLKIVAADTSQLIISGSMTLGLAALLCYYSVYSTGTSQRTRFRYIYYSSNYKVFINNESGKRELYIYNNASSDLVANINISALNTNTPYCEVVDALPTSYVEYDSSYALARLSSNVASATKLQTARTIWGQSFDGTADVSGDLSVGNGDIYLMNNRIIRAYPTSGSSIELLKLNASNIFVLGKGAAVNGYNTYLDGNNIHFRYGTSPTTGMILNSSGNILIGTTTDSGAKLTVNGSALATSFVTSGGTASLFVKGDGSLDDKAYITATDIVNTATNGIFYIEGTGTTAGTWLGEHASISLYYKGLTIAYKIPIAGASTTTININSLGAKTVRRNDSALTTHLPVNSVVILVYDGTYFRWSDYDANSYAYVRLYLTDTTAAEYPLLFRYDTNAPSSYVTQYTRYDSAITVNPSTNTITAALFNGPAASVSNKLILKVNGGTTEGTNLYTYNGSAAKTLDIKAGNNITLTATAGILTIASSYTNTTYTLSGQLSGNTFVTTLTPSSGTPTTATVPAMTAATSSAAGKAGLVPAPAKGQQAYFLRGDGTWVVPTNTWRNIKVNGTQIAGTGTGTYSVDYLSGDGISVTGVAGTSTTKNNTITITNTGVRSVTIGTGDNANKVAVNTGGTTTYLTIPYATYSTHLIGGALGSIPYQSAADTTTFLAAPTTNGYVLKYNTTDKKPYWAADSNTKNTAGSTNSTSKLFLIGATSLAANPLTYSNSAVFATNGTLNATNFVSGTGVSDFSAGTVKLDTLNIPTASGGTTFGPGTSGLVLKSNGTTVYWASDSNSDTKVTQSSTTTASYRPVILGYTASDTAGSELTTNVTNLVYVSNNFYVQPSSGILYARAFNAPTYKTDSLSVLGYSTNEGDWTGSLADSVIVGANAPTIIRSSGNNLYHYNWTTGTRYIIWDSYNSDRVRLASYSVPATKQWYRIASTNTDVGNNNCTFYITGIASGYHTNVIINASISYNGATTAPSIIQLGCSSYSTLLTEARIVWNLNAYEGKQAHLEVYMYTAIAATFHIRCVGYGWNTLRSSVLAGSIPSGYTQTKINLINGVIVGNLSGNASTASKLATARTISLTGSVTGSGSFDGSGNLSIATTTNHSHTIYKLQSLSCSDLNNPNWNTTGGITADLYNGTASNAPYLSNNANGVINFSFTDHGASGLYGFLLAHSNSSERLYFRLWSYGNISSWRTIAYTSDIPNMGLITITKSIRVTTSWLNTGIYCSDIGTGAFVVMIENVNDWNNGGLHYNEYYVGLMASWASGSNSGEIDDILLHRCGHAPNSSVIYLRTARVGGNASSPLLLIAGNYNMNSALNITFKFRRII